MIRWATHLSFSPVAAIVYAMSPGRMGASLGMVLGLIGVIAGSTALARSGRRGALVALALGPIGFILGGLVVATAESGVGTGAGVAGGIVAIVIGLIAMALGGLALARSRRTAPRV